eukprot:scaffold26312_cov137-Cylindrotheca_fusiformis.AAC.1
MAQSPKFDKIWLRLANPVTPQCAIGLWSMNHGRWYVNQLFSPWNTSYRHHPVTLHLKHKVESNAQTSNWAKANPKATKASNGFLRTEGNGKIVGDIKARVRATIMGISTYV